MFKNILVPVDGSELSRCLRALSFTDHGWGGHDSVTFRKSFPAAHQLKLVLA